MVAKKLMIQGLRKQENNLKTLLEMLESKSNPDAYDYLFFDEVVNTVRNNLKRLRQMKNAYCEHQDLMVCN